MRQITLYKFPELPGDEAKEAARAWGRQCVDNDPPWGDESRQSIQTFCADFGVTLKGWSVSAGSYVYTLPKLDNSTFRGLKLRDVKRDNMPTGYCIDCTLWETFHDEWERTGDPKHAFNEAVRAGFKAWADDWDASLSDEAIDDFLTANEYEFTEEGDRV
jgi:hypothetical protein